MSFKDFLNEKAMFVYHLMQDDKVVAQESFPNKPSKDELESIRKSYEKQTKKPTQIVFIGKK